VLHNLSQVGLHWEMLALVRSIYIKLVIGGDVADVQVYNTYITF
jgi:hypothetical protein